MKILILMDCFRYGGLSKMVNWLCSTLNQSGYDATLCSIYSSQYTNRLDENTKFVSLGLQESENKIERNTILLLKKIKRFNNYLRHNHFDVILSVGDPSLYLALLFRKKYKYKIIVSERVDPYTTRSKGDIIRRKLYYLCDSFVFQTNEAKDYFNEPIKSKAYVIPNPVIMPPNLPQWSWNNSQNSLVYAGRYDNYQKRIDLLLESFAIVHKSYPDIILEIFGGGYDNALVKKLCDQFSITDSVIFHGVTNNIYSELIKSKIFVFTSDYEGIPNAVIEAMMVGMPIVSTDTSPGGTKMLLQNKYGVLVERGNANAVAEGIVYLLENKELAESMGNSARESLNRFNKSDITKLWLNVFSNI